MQSKRREFAAGAKIICAGEVSDSMYVVCSGLVSCQVAGNEVKQIAAGQTFGELAIYYDHMCTVFQEHKSIIGDHGPLEKM
jgi:CRP-like cAMP-binding protein